MAVQLCNTAVLVFYHGYNLVPGTTCLLQIYFINPRPSTFRRFIYTQYLQPLASAGILGFSSHQA